MVQPGLEHRPPLLIGHLLNNPHNRLAKINNIHKPLVLPRNQKILLTQNSQIQQNYLQTFLMFVIYGIVYGIVPQHVLLV